MLYNFTNHLGTAILDSLGNNIQFEQSGAIDKLLTVGILSQFTESSLLTKEIKLNNFSQDPAFGFTNHLGSQITNHLLTPIYFVPNNGCKVASDLNASAQLHKLINATGNGSISMNADTIRYKVLLTTIDGSVGITGTFLKEGNLATQIAALCDLSAVLNNYRNINLSVLSNIDISGIQTKEVALNNFGQYPLSFTNHLGDHITDHLLADITLLQITGIKSAFDMNSDIKIYVPTDAGINTIFTITGESKAYNNMAAAIDFILLVAGTQTKQIGINTFSLIDNLRSSFTIAADAQLHKLIDSAINGSVTISAEAFNQRLLNSEIDSVIGITGSQLKEGYLSGQILTMNEISTVLNIYRNMNSECHFNADLEAFLMHRISGWDTLIIKFKE
jgi:hypothetical protein